jgi:protein TonB
MDMDRSVWYKRLNSAMSAIPQFRANQKEAISAAGPEVPQAPSDPSRDNPLQLLRYAIEQLKSPTGGLPDQEQLANLLVETREALEHANVVAHAVSQCEQRLGDVQFEKAFEALDDGLRAYPGDPALVTRRRQVEERQKAFHSAAAAREAIEEADWLLNQDRTDLAAQLLREKAAELPDQEELTARLTELEALLLVWEERRGVRDALGRAMTLEQSQQWLAALTVVEEAQQTYPSSEELAKAAERIRNGLTDDRRRKKLVRRLELIGHQIAAKSWRQALSLLENTRLEFPDARELEPLGHEIDAGLKRSECDEILSEVRRCLADSDLEQAEKALRRGLDALGPEPALEALQNDVESERMYRDGLRRAQVLFGRRQFQESEQVLMQLEGEDRQEARALLDAVRAARAATEEESFLERGREKALGLMQQHQYAQAADLLRNLLSLFPANPILERDLMTAQDWLGRNGPPVAPNTQPEAREPCPEIVELQTSPVGSTFLGRFRRAAIAGGTSLVLLSAAGGAWKIAHRSPPISNPPAAPAETGAPAPPSNLPAVEPTAPAQTAAERPVATRAAQHETRQAKQSFATASRAFVPPRPERLPGRTAEPASPPPEAGPIVIVEPSPGLPDTVAAPEKLPAPSPAAAPATPVKPSLPPGGRLEQAQLIKRRLPEYPALARQRAVLGVVRLEVLIDEHGDVQSVKVLSGDVVLGAAAKNAVQTWKYRPATLNDRPIAIKTEVDLVFGDRK